MNEISEIIEIHKFVDCDNDWFAEIWATVNNKTGEVITEEIVMSKSVFHAQRKAKDERS